MENKEYIILKGLEKSNKIIFSETQNFLLENIKIIEIFYWFLFTSSILTVIYYKIYKENKYEK